MELQRGGDFGKLPLDLQRYLFSFFSRKELGLIRSACKHLLSIVDAYSTKFVIRVQPDPDGKKSVRNILSLI